MAWVRVASAKSSSSCSSRSLMGGSSVAMGGEVEQCLPGQPVGGPLFLGAGAEGFVEIDCRGVPVQYGPFETAAVAGDRQLRQVAQQRLAGAQAAGLGADVEVFQVQPVLAEPGGIVEEVHRVADGLAVLLADQRV